MTKVSVVIPTYNRANYIMESIQSVFDQTFTDFEIIVVDDGSTDNTGELITGLHDSRIKYVYQENRGVARAANRCFELSSGEYIALFSSDDVLLEHALEMGVKVLDNHPEVGFSYGQAYLIDEKGGFHGMRKYTNKNFYVREGIEEIKELLFGNYITAPTVLVRRSCLFDVGLYDPVGSEDYDLMVRLAKKYSVAHIAEPMVKYRIHTGSISYNRNLEEIKESNSRIFEGIFNDTRLGPLLANLKAKTYFFLYLRLGSLALDKKDMKAARKYLFQALKMYPLGFFNRQWQFWFAKTLTPPPVLKCLRQVRGYFRWGQQTA